MSLKSQAISGVKWNSIATVYNIFMQIIRIAILTRLLDKSDFGLVAIATMVISFTDIFSDLGFTVAVIHKQNVSRNQFSSLYWMNLFTSTILFVVAAFSSPLFSSFYHEPILNIIIPLLGVQIFLNAFGKLFQTIKTKNLEFRFLSIVRISSITIGLIVTTLLALWGLGIYSLIIGQLVQVGINQLCYAIAGSKEMKVSFHFKYSEISEFVKIGIYQIGANFLDFVSNKIDIFLIGRFFGMDDLGIYNLAKDLVLKPKQIIATLINGVISSAFAKIQQDLALVRETYKKLVDIVTFIALPIFILMAIYAESIVTILYSAEYIEVASLLRILSVVGLFMTIDSLASTVVLAFGRTEIGFYWTIVRVVLSAVTIVVASTMSIEAVAWGQVVVAILSFFLFWRFAIYSIIKLKLLPYIGAMTKNCKIAMIVSIPFVIQYSFYSPGNTFTILLFAIYFIVYGIVSFIFRKDLIVSLKKILHK